MYTNHEFRVRFACENLYVNVIFEDRTLSKQYRSARFKRNSAVKPLVKQCFCIVVCIQT